MLLDDGKDEHFSCFLSSCQLGLMRKFFKFHLKFCKNAGIKKNATSEKISPHIIGKLWWQRFVWAVWCHWNHQSWQVRTNKYDTSEMWVMCKHPLHLFYLTVAGHESTMGKFFCFFHTPLLCVPRIVASLLIPT